jgi:hypothetical protein
MPSPRPRRRLRLLLLSCLTLGLVVLPASTGLAQAETFTVTVKDVTETFPEVNPCTGVPGTVTITYNAVFHFTETKNGVHLTGTTTGVFTFVPDDPAEPTYTGHFAQWFGENYNPNIDNATFTFNVVGKGSDGSRLNFHVVSHVTAETIDFTTDPPTFEGVRVEFERARCQ